MYSKKLILLTALMAPSFNLISMTRQDLLALHASLTALNQSIPASSSSAAPATTSETKAAAEIIALVNDPQIDPILKTIASELSKQKESMTEGSIKENIQKQISALKTDYENSLAQNNAQRLQKIQQALLNVYLALKAIPKAPKYTGGRIDLQEQAMRMLDINLEVTGKFLADEGFDTASINDKFIMGKFNTIAEVIPQINEAFLLFTQAQQKEGLKNWRKEQTKLEVLIKSAYFNSYPVFKDALAKAKEILPQLDAFLQKAGGSEANAGAETKLAGEAQAPTDPKVEQLKQSVLKILGQKKLYSRVNGDSTDDIKQLTTLLQKLIDEYWEAMFENKANKILQAHNALYDISQYKTTFGSYDREAFAPLRSFLEQQGFDQSTINNKAFNYKLQRIKGDSMPATMAEHFLTQAVKSPYLKEKYPDLMREAEALLEKQK